MSQETSSLLLFVINPISGGKEKNEHQQIIEEHFSQLPFTIKKFVLTGKNNSVNLQKYIEEIKPHTVVAVGGDGTVTMVAKLILASKMNLAIIPAGSANGMAVELNIPLDIKEALSLITTGKVKQADVIRVNKEICLHLSDIGMNARLIKYFEEGNMRGKWGYAKVALKVLLQKRNISVAIKLKDKIIHRNAFMIVIANASKYGTGAIINPRGDLYDGIFEVVIIKQLGLGTLLKLWLRPQHLDPAKIECLQATSIKIDTRKKIDFQVDGEYLGKVKRVEASILAGHLNIIVPA